MAGDFDIFLSTVHDHLKVVVSIEMANRTKVDLSFPQILAGSEQSTFVFDAPQNMLKVHTEDKILTVMSRRVWS